MPRILKLVLMLFVSLAACAKSEIRPVAVGSSDMCSFCRMAISEKQYASEIITEDDQVLKFDDVGCLLRYRKASGLKLTAAAIFVTDVDTRKWLKAEEAYFVRSRTAKTPMGSGIVAYGDKAKAGDESVRFEDLDVP